MDKKKFYNKNDFPKMTKNSHMENPIGIMVENFKKALNKIKKRNNININTNSENFICYVNSEIEKIALDYSLDGFNYDSLDTHIVLTNYENQIEIWLENNLDINII